MNIGIIGSRKRNSSSDFEKLLNILVEIDCSEVNIISGGCKTGGDLFAEILAKVYFVPITIHHPNQENLKTLMDSGISYKTAYAKVAYARNTLIARDSDILIAVVSPDRKGGTEDTIKKFLKKLTMTEEQAILNYKLYLI